MMLSSELTRQVYWSPAGGLLPWVHMSSYFWLVVALFICFWGIYRRIKIWKMGRQEICFDKPLLRLNLFIKNVLGQARVLRKRTQRGMEPKSLWAAIMHGTIFYGFMALVFGTTIVALKEYGIVDLYRGWFYAFVKIICQLGGFALVIGLGMGVFRRSRKPTEFHHGLDYSVMYILLVLLAVQGFVIQGLRLAVEPSAQDKSFAFFGIVFSYLFPKNMNIASADFLYSGLWYFHMLTTMAFVALIPYTRFFHIFTATLNLVTARLEPTVRLATMNFDNSDVDYFGAKTTQDFTWKDRLSFDSCTECRRCTDVCPANAVDKPLDPRQVILKLRDSMSVEAQLMQKEGKISEQAQLYESNKITHDEIWACTNCGGCVHECPVGINQLRTIMDLRRYQTLTLGEVPSSAGKAIENIKQYGNPWGLSSSDRLKWAEGLDIPIITSESPEVEYLYYVGCAGAYDSHNQKVARSVVQILKSCGVDFAVMGKAEKCNGEAVKRLGDEYSFSEIARSNVEHLSKLKFKKIVTHCPHCYSVFKHDYQDYGGVYEVYHHTQLLSALHQSGKLKLPNAVEKEVTFHDPCFLGRHNGEYEAPRQLLEAIAGLRLYEMEKSKESSSCCGMGGGNMWYESEGGSKKIVENRLSHVAATGAKTLVTGCSFCLINFKSAFAQVKETENLEIIDIAQAVSQALGDSKMV